jgi:hypothetical protein
MCSSENPRYYEEILRNPYACLKNNASNGYGRCQMHYLVLGTELTENFWKIFDMMCRNNRAQFSVQDCVYGRYVLHYVMDRVWFGCNDRSALQILLEVANKTFSGYHVADTLYYRTARSYIDNLYDGILVKLVDKMYYKKALKIQSCYRKYKFRKVMSEFEFLPPNHLCGLMEEETSTPSNHFCGGIKYIEASQSFENSILHFENL